ncbi:MAG: GNAT family N-acetyltransferase [Hyphomicrobiaceae bacterium]
MTLIIRQPTVDELPTLSDLCLRSKAIWGYDAAFMNACREELTLRQDDFATSHIGVAAANAAPVGVVQVVVAGDEADLQKLFVEPTAMRGGIGRKLFGWACDVTRRSGARQLSIEADPDAAPFYRRMGARDDGHAASGSIPGRLLPRLVFDVDAGR